MVRFDYENAMTVLDFIRRKKIPNTPDVNDVVLSCNKIAGAYACNDRSMCDNSDFQKMNQFATKNSIPLF